jgi:hypothetical protein
MSGPGAGIIALPGQSVRSNLMKMKDSEYRVGSLTVVRKGFNVRFDN